MSRRAVAELFDYADHLMAGNHGRLARRQLAFHDVQIGAAYAAHAYAHENFAFARTRFGGVRKIQRILINGSGRMEEAGLHIVFIGTFHTKAFIESQAR